MRATAAFRALGPIDLRAVLRESLLLWMFLLPLGLGLLLRFGLPPLSATLLREFGFDLIPYHHLVTCYALVMTPPMAVGLVCGFLLLDERDDQTLTALLVTPLSLESYLLYRIGTPLLLGTTMALAALAISGLPTIPWPQLCAVVLLASFEGPIVALLLAAFVDNKVQGLAVMKALGAVIQLPVFAWFVAWPWQLWVGLLPSYWPLRSYWSATDLDALFFASLAIGFATHAALLWLLLRRFRKQLHR